MSPMLAGITPFSNTAVSGGLVGIEGSGSESMSSAASAAAMDAVPSEISRSPRSSSSPMITGLTYLGQPAMTPTRPLLAFDELIEVG